MEDRPQLAGRRIDVLDGLRGVAILVVLVFHFFTWPVGGFLGVDLFFALSGFLITNRLLRDSAVFGKRHLGDFYYGRVLRIVPALVEMIVLYGAIKLAYPDNVKMFRDNVLASVFLVSNWTRAFQLPYPDYLGHMWSLSIEEQYYLIWPLTVLVTLAVGRSRRTLVSRERSLAVVAAVLIAGLWMERFALAMNHSITPDRLYNGTDTRISAIIMGCLMAVVLRDVGFREALRRRPRGALASLLLGLGVVIGCMAKFDWRDRALFYWGLSLFSTACAVLLVYLVAFRESVAGRAMSWRPLVWMGKRSYGLYLFHFPIFFWLHMVMRVQPGWKMALFCGPPTLLLATLSWRYVEEPFMRLRYRKNVAPAATAFAARV